MIVLEALADAFMHHEGWFPGSRSNRNRNPGNLRAFQKSQPVDDGGYRIFTSLPEGYQALLDDLSAKLHGSHGLNSTSTLLDLLNIYAPAGDNNNPSAYAVAVAQWATAALSKPITVHTTLGELQTA
jgi:hypothetical protein